MTNLVVSRVCNLSCPYCFAKPVLATSSAPKFVPLAVYEKWLDYLERSAIPEARLIGGEPTLHPQFSELVHRARQRGLRLKVFTHGLISESALTCLEDLPISECNVLVNLNTSGEFYIANSRNYYSATAPERSWSPRKLETFRRLGERSTPGITIDQANFVDLLDPGQSTLIELIQTTGCKPALRLGVAQPAPDSRNSHFNPRLYPVIGGYIARFAHVAAQAGIHLELDCGFVRCMFTQIELDILQQAGCEVAYHCSPVLDLNIDGRVFHCFPLAGRMETRFSDGARAVDLRATLNQQAQPFRTVGIYRECSSCYYKENNVCSGGCLALTQRRFRQVNLSIHLP
jgi:organic radical activating enzyme